MTRIQKLIDFVRGGKTTYEEVKKLGLSESEKQIVESSKKSRDGKNNN